MKNKLSIRYIFSTLFFTAILVGVFYITYMKVEASPYLIARIEEINIRINICLYITLTLLISSLRSVRKLSLLYVSILAAFMAGLEFSSEFHVSNIIGYLVVTAIFLVVANLFPKIFQTLDRKIDLLYLVLAFSILRAVVSFYLGEKMAEYIFVFFFLIKVYESAKCILKKAPYAVDILVAIVFLFVLQGVLGMLIIAIALDISKKLVSDIFYKNEMLDEI